MATKHEDHKTEHKDRPMPVQGDRTAVPEQGVRIDDIRKADINRPKSFLDEPMDPRTGLRGRPESPSDNPGQKTRDNVTPVIPSAPPREGGIVDPTSLGMPQGGVQPVYPPPVKSVNEPSTPAEHAVNPDDLPPGHFNASINEPPGSNVGGESAGGEGDLDEAPDLESLDPDEADAGDATDIVMHVHGTGFTGERHLLQRLGRADHVRQRDRGHHRRQAEPVCGARGLPGHGQERQLRKRRTGVRVP